MSLPNIDATNQNYKVLVNGSPTFWFQCQSNLITSFYSYSSLNTNILVPTGTITADSVIYTIYDLTLPATYSVYSFANTQYDNFFSNTANQSLQFGNFGVIVYTNYNSNGLGYYKIFFSSMDTSTNVYSGNYSVYKLSETAGVEPILVDSSINFTLQIITNPDPANSIVASSGNNQAYISWNPPSNDGNSSIINYDIYNYSFNTTSENFYGIENGGTTTFTVTVPNEKAYVTGETVQVVLSTDSTIYFLGEITSYSTLSGILSLNNLVLQGTIPDSISTYNIYSYNSKNSSLSSETNFLYNGLTNLKKYAFEVLAANNSFTSYPSEYSNSVQITNQAPSAPQNVTATINGSNIDITWTAPSETGGSPITNYTIYTTPTTVTTVVDDLILFQSYPISNYSPGVSYVFNVYATNSNPSDSVPGSSLSIVPNPTVPTAPTDCTAVAGNQSVLVSWTPQYDGGSVITSYTIESYIGGISNGQETTTDNTVTAFNYTGLTNGTTYTFKVYATNAYGDSLYSNESNEATPLAVPPTAPTSLLATSGNKEATITFSGSSSDGGSSILSYTIKSSPENKTATIYAPFTLPLQATITGLTNGVPYYFTGIATNVAGNSTASDASNFVTPTGEPNAPTSVNATASSSSAIVSWNPSTDFGGYTSLSYYQVTASPGGATENTASGTETSLNFINLIPGTSYTFTVKAFNLSGSSTSSSPSNTVIPYTVSEPPTNVVAVNGPSFAQATISWTAPVNTGYTPITGYIITSSLGNIETTDSSTFSCTFSNLNKQNYTFSVVAVNAAGYSTQAISNQLYVIGIDICFLRGSKILTLRGEKEEYIQIENLRKGDLIKTAKSGYKPIKEIGYSSFYQVDEFKEKTKKKLYILKKEKFTDLFEDLIVTGCHCILRNYFVDEKEYKEIFEEMKEIFVTEGYFRIPAYIARGSDIYENSGLHEIWHLALEHYDDKMNYAIYANGLLVESTSLRMMRELSNLTLIE
jgi:hypothetical protein